VTIQKTHQRLPVSQHEAACPKSGIANFAVPLMVSAPLMVSCEAFVNPGTVPK
jgi:hypothetical protein